MMTRHVNNLDMSQAAGADDICEVTIHAPHNHILRGKQNKTKPIMSPILEIPEIGKDGQELNLRGLLRACLFALCAPVPLYSQRGLGHEDPKQVCFSTTEDGSCAKTGGGLLEPSLVPEPLPWSHCQVRRTEPTLSHSFSLTITSHSCLSGKGVL